MRADAESSCTESRTDSWSPDGARNPWSAPTTELWAPTRNAVTSVAERLVVAGEGLSIRRARVSWLAAHVTAGTNLAALHIISGRAGAQTLDVVLDHVATAMSPPFQMAVTVDARYVLGCARMSSWLPSGLGQDD